MVVWPKNSWQPVTPVKYIFIRKEAGKKKKKSFAVKAGEVEIEKYILCKRKPICK
jgi:hypothetical protein